MNFLPNLINSLRPQPASPKSRIKNLISRICLVTFILHPSAFSLKADITRSNPFIPEGWIPPSERVITAPPPPPPPVNLELRGTDEWNGVKSFYLYDKIKQTGRWINLNDQSADTPVLSFNHSGDKFTIDVRVNGKVEKISLKKSDGKPIPITDLAKAPELAPPTAVPGQPPAPGIPGQPPPPAPVRRRVILPGQAPDAAQAGTPQIDASNPNNAAILKMVEGANSQVAPAIPPPPGQ